MNLAEAICLHCGAPISGGVSRRFCCQGCETVFGVLEERGVRSNYYALKSGTQVRGVAPVHVNPAAEDFTYLNQCRDLTMQFYLEGVHCAACVWLTEKLPEWVPQVQSLKLDLSTSIATVKVSDQRGLSLAAHELSKLGYRPHPILEGKGDELRRKEDRVQLARLAVAGACSGNIMLLAIALYAGADGGLAEMFRGLSLALYLPVLFFSAVPFYQSAWASLRVRQLSIDVPIVLGMSVGTLASVWNLIVGGEHLYFDSLSALVFLLLATRYLLRRLHQSAAGASKLVYHLAPHVSLKRIGTEWRSVRTESLIRGDVVRVLPGQTIPVDGVIVGGESSVDLALLTGESVPSSVKVGDAVTAGTSNLNFLIDVEVRASGSATRMGQILSATQESLERKPPIVTFLDRVGQAFVWAVLLLSGIGFIIGLSVSWHEAVSRALAVAIIVCPCTFALATPLAMGLAIARSARAGVVVKGADVIERLSRIKRVYFDKTGTLTTGKLTVVRWDELAPGSAEALLALERLSSHPIAKAVQRYFKRLNPCLEVTEYQEVSGVGLTGRVRGVLFEVKSLLGALQSKVGVYREGELVGVLSLSDNVRPDSRKSISALRQMGLEVHMLSGDAEGPALSVAEEVGIPRERVWARTSPEKKKEHVEHDPYTLMVGEGANDSIALAAASVGLAVQGGLEVSLKAAGAYSSRPGIAPVVFLVRVASETMKVIRRNLVFAVVYNVIGVGVALSGHLNPVFAAVLMPVSALTVFLSTLLGTTELRCASKELTQ